VQDEPAKRHASAEYRFAMLLARLSAQMGKHLNLVARLSPSLPTPALYGCGIHAAIERQF
jgi:hypothetical protein